MQHTPRFYKRHDPERRFPLAPRLRGMWGVRFLRGCLLITLIWRTRLLGPTALCGVQLAAEGHSLDGSSSNDGAAPGWYSGYGGEAAAALRVAMELSSITRTAGWGLAKGSLGDMGSILKFGNGSNRKSHGPSGCPSSALGKISRVGSRAIETTGFTSSCIWPRRMYVCTTMVVVATIVLVFSSCSYAYSGGSMIHSTGCTIRI